MAASARKRAVSTVGADARTMPLDMRPDDSGRPDGKYLKPAKTNPTPSTANQTELAGIKTATPARPAPATMAAPRLAACATWLPGGSSALTVNKRAIQWE